MKTQIQNPYRDRRCFYCGSENEEGLKLKFYLDDGTKEVSSEYFPAKPFYGQGNVLHGGIQMGLLDEIMGWASYVYTGEMAVTSNINVNFLRPVYIGNKVKCICRITSRKEAKVYMYAWIENTEGLVCSDANGIYHVLPHKKYETLIHGR
jgi:uncharacterized protein (TIGR00369 family)